jgi:hypothetical protein
VITHIVQDENRKLIVYLSVVVAVCRQNTPTIKITLSGSANTSPPL